MRTKSYREFFLEIDDYERRCSARNRRVALLFLSALVPAFSSIAFMSRSSAFVWMGGLPYWAGNAALGTSLVSVTLVGIYVLVSSRSFHRSAAPKCDSCGTSLGAIDELMVVEWRLADQAVRVKCSHCGYLMATWN